MISGRTTTKRPEHIRAFRDQNGTGGPRPIGSLASSRNHAGAHLLAQFVDGLEHAGIFEVPERPAIAGIQTLHFRAHAVDGSGVAARSSLSHRPGRLPHDADAASLRIAPGFNMPDSMMLPKATRGSARLPVMTVSSAPANGSTEAMRAVAASMYFCSRSMPTKWRPSRFATAPVVPDPKKGSRMTSPGFDEAMRMRANKASGFWVGCILSPFSSFRRSAPVQMGKSQSDRICRSSLAAFIAS